MSKLFESFIFGLIELSKVCGIRKTIRDDITIINIDYPGHSVKHEASLKNTNKINKEYTRLINAKKELRAKGNHKK